MTDVLFIPDTSHHQLNLDVARVKAEGMSALIARIGQGAGRRRNGTTYGTTRDTVWTARAAAARTAGLPLVGYWYVGNLITPDENARLCKLWMGDIPVPIMLDFEDASGEAPFYQLVLAAFARAGLRVILGYYPHWYWEATGGGSIAGPPIVNSAYPGGTGTSAQIYGDGSRHAKNWISYGGGTTLLLQFTNQAQVAGNRLDCSAFKGSHAALMTLINGAPAPGQRKDNMAYPVQLEPHPAPADPNAPDAFREITIALPPQHGATGVAAVWACIANSNSDLHIRVADWQCGAPGDGNHRAVPMLERDTVIDPLGTSGGRQAPADAYGLVIDYQSQYGASIVIEPVQG